MASPKRLNVEVLNDLNNTGHHPASQGLQRETLRLKCSGLTGSDTARRSVEPSTLSLLGPVRRMETSNGTGFAG